MRVTICEVGVEVPERWPTYPTTSKKAIERVVAGLKRAHPELLHSVTITGVRVRQSTGPQVYFSYSVDPAAPPKPLDPFLSAELNCSETARLADWLQRPSGALLLGDRCTFEAVEGGGILVKTLPYVYRRKERS